ncbi:sensor domain-containing diguanylate cyclase [Novosphingobium mangrovi (ex Huang et al. 2023)]|uniref:diguanylate cyclase n=1 Tax=Novosphingobium mangrovi (ex Huang et al. 2023) TaxID=2976432 RepID=A0ABT2I203_9SPHN|nr:sensor domain-containing diguanylate cyclase [Novosphingobium mangrovi (ex Huang et al. 2023)]MCT2398826.1 sensor domain-containing diguanylate cyclase [Novosphingobium mangrovi (ex Huang et al. 2023)]
MLLSVVSVAASIFLTGPAARAASWTALTCTLVIFAIGVAASRRAIGEMHQHLRLFDEARSTSRQIEELFAMTDMLQAAENHEDAGAVLMATAQRLLPEFGGALYVFNNSRDRLDLAKAWNESERFEPAATLLPTNCWALKRGKPHINDMASGTLCCMHQIGGAATLELPMMARGQVYGLLILALDDSDAYTGLMQVRRIARALADSMSLALSNIALREKLRTQSLRDPLTGLYNRRYMEDALERYVSLAERTGSATSVVMIDLDNFKRLNDDYGHAKGDAVLRDVASQLVGALRPSDVVARYGGEELMVILPSCGIEDATAKAEMLRMRIESLSEVHCAPVSASLGVAAVPETATSMADVIPMADAALYAAKKAGKNRVVVADKRPKGTDGNGPRLAVTG